MTDNALTRLSDDILSTAFPAYKALSDDTVAALRAAAEQVAAPVNTPPRPQEKFKYEMQILRALHLERAHSAIIEIVDAGQAAQRPGTAPTFWYLDALEKCGRTDRLIKTIQATPLDPASPLMGALTNRYVLNGLPISTKNAERIFGPERASLSAMLDNLPLEVWRTDRTEILANALYDLGPRDQSRDAFHNRLVWGQAAQVFMRLVHRELLYPSLTTAVRQAGAPLDAGPLEAASRGGRSIVVTQAHTGTYIGAVAQVKAPGLSKLILSKHGNQNQEGATNLATNDTPHLALLGAIKLLRKSPHLVTIYPDGGTGQDLLTFDFFGHDIKIGPGGASIAWHAKAATFFTAARWDGPTLHPYLVTGPSAEPDGDRETFEEAFHDFYLDQLRDIALGRPENIGMPTQAFIGFINGQKR